MKSKVYFIRQTNSDDLQSVNRKLSQLLEKSGVLDFLTKDSSCAVKVHFGEEGNTGFVNSRHLRVVCDKIKDRGARPYLSDANTLYRGRRLNCSDHLKLAIEHGFSEEITGADIIIPDDTRPQDSISLEINRKFIKKAKVGRFYIDSDSIVAVSHFKGHILTGFGGALKNIGMGCATREGKLAQHCDLSPVVHRENCLGCGECAKVCPNAAICIDEKKASINQSKCVGCASCLAACPTMAMFIDFGAGDKVQEKMVEYALAVLQKKKDNSAFINFALKINKECDCWSMENPRIAPDVGILASSDPVSVDKASLDLVNKSCGRDIFKETHPEQDGLKQLLYAQELGLGKIDYELVELN